MNTLPETESFPEESPTRPIEPVPIARVKSELRAIRRFIDEALATTTRELCAVMNRIEDLADQIEERGLR